MYRKIFNPNSLGWVTIILNLVQPNSCTPLVVRIKTNNLMSIRCMLSDHLEFKVAGFISANKVLTRHSELSFRDSLVLKKLLARITRQKAGRRRDDKLQMIAGNKNSTMTSWPHSHILLIRKVINKQNNTTSWNRKSCKETKTNKRANISSLSFQFPQSPLIQSILSQNRVL